VRGILWHQLTDLENDRRGCVRTFATRYPQHVVVRLGAFVAFPIELLALAAMLWQMRSWWPAGLLVAYALLMYLRVLRWHMRIVVVEPRERFLIAMHEYYDAFLPLAILIASAQRNPFDWIVLIIHLLVFPTRLWQVVSDIAKLFRERHHPSDW
jgi:hypothetical protein